MPTAIYQLTARLASDDTLMSRHDGQFTDTSFIFPSSHGGHSHRQISMQSAKLLEIGSTIRSIQAPFLDLHDIRLDVMEVTLHEDEEPSCSVISHPTALYKQSKTRLHPFLKQ